MAMTTLRPFVAFFVLISMVIVGARGADAMPDRHTSPVQTQATPPKLILAGYETVRAALANDDLAAARAAAQALATNEVRQHHRAIADSAQDLVTAGDFTAARAAFKVLSHEAIALARTLDGFFIMTCPMAEADWVQTTRDMSNPYLGKDMPTCGSVVEETKG